MNLWPKDIKEAKKIQINLSKRCKFTPLEKKPKYICGVDAAYSNQFVFGCASLFKFPELIPVEDKTVKIKADFPYIPGFLSFREGKAVLKSVKSLSIKPDVIIFDGQGIAHPLSFGIACHIGVLLDISSIGCAKSRLVGEYEEPDYKRGSFSYLYYRGEVVGAVLRTKDKTKPLFISPGHLIDIASAINIILKSTKNYRIPEPLRRAHQVANLFKKNVS